MIMSMASSPATCQFGVKRTIGRPKLWESSFDYKGVLLKNVNFQKRFLKKRSLLIKSLSTENGGFKKQIHGIGEKDGVIFVDHGSRRKESNLKLDEFVAMFKDRTGYPIVEPAHMELAEPSIRDAFGSCVRQGADRVILSPFFLFPGRHWIQDIPSLTAEAAKDHPGIPYIVTVPLGHHELLVEILNSPLSNSDGKLSIKYRDVVDDIILHCFSHVAGDAEECSVCAGTGKCSLYSQ